MKDALLHVCKCGVMNGLSGRAIVYDPVTKMWSLVVWPVREGQISIHGLTPVQFCPVCGDPVSKDGALGARHIPSEAMTHLRAAHSRPETNLATPEPAANYDPFSMVVPTPKEA